MPIDYSTYYTEGTYTSSGGGLVKYVPMGTDVKWEMTGNAFGMLFHILRDGECVATVIARRSSNGEKMVLFNRHLISVDNIPVELFNEVFKEVTEPGINSEVDNNADN